MARTLLSVPNTDTASTDYPNGKVRDKAGAVAGTTGGELLLGDIIQFFEKLKIDAGITENGLPDNVSNGYQLLTALVSKIEETSLKTKVIEIGDWDMSSSSAVAIAHGIADISKIRSISAIVRNDANTLFYQAPFGSDDFGIGGYGAVPGYLVLAIKVSGSYFDTSDFNATSYNRGWVTVQYEA